MFPKTKLEVAPFLGAPALEVDNFRFYSLAGTS